MKVKSTITSLVVRTILIVVLIALALYFLYVPPKAIAAEPFDHSTCQYPNRLSNPVDGCNNTDPARPECMKYGTEDCTDLSAEKVVSQPVSEIKIDSTALDEVISSCSGGK